MIKTLSNVLKQDKEKFAVPRKVQDLIPIRTIWPDGVFLNTKNKFSKSYMYTDINYAVAAYSDKETMFYGFGDIINSLDPGCTAKFTINKCAINMLDFQSQTLMSMDNDDFDGFRNEYNEILSDVARDSNKIKKEMYVTISVNRKNVEDSRLYFARVGSDLTAHFARISSNCTELSANDRLRIIHNFFRVGEETSYYFDIKDHMRRGADFKDYICPDSFEYHSDYFKIGNRYGRVLFLRDFAAYIQDEMLAEMTDLNRNLMLSIDVVPIPTDEAVKEVEQRLLGVETNITNWQRKQNMNNNFSAIIPYDMEQQRKETREVLDDVVSKDQRLLFAVMTMVHTADSKEQLDSDTEEILTIVRKRLCQMSVLRYQQIEGLKTALPFGVRKIDAFRTMTTESLAVFMPFRVQEVYDSHGIYYGQNVISKNMMIADRRKLLNGNSFILGVSGSGKSFTAKNEIVNLRLATDADIIVVDPEREYAPLIKALGGSVIEISATSPNHINAMDMSRDYGETDPIIEKSQFLQSLCEQIIAGHKFSKGQQSIIDRCTENVYRYYKQGNYMGTPPTLQDFRDELLKQPEPEAHSLALELELFTRGSLNTFAKQTNVDTSNRLICYDILELGEQLRSIGMLVILDSILNRITANRQKGKQTFVFIDEVYLLFMHEYSAQFLFKLWKRVRKYGAFCTGITQNVTDLLQSHTARTMLANSEFIIMLNQAATDRIELAKLLNISEEQLSFITDVEAGCGLIKVGSSLVPFENKFPKETKLYKLMSTKNYCILYSDGVWENEEEQAPYTIVAVCPVKNSKAVLRYKDNEFRGAPTGSVLSGPLLGMLCFPDYASYYFSKEKHQELIDAVGTTPKSADEIKDLFYTALSETLGEDAFSVIAAVQKKFVDEESVIKDSLCDIISDRLSDEKAEQFRAVFQESQIPNLGDKVTVETPNLKATARADNLRTQKINGQECIVIPVEDIVKINGTSVGE